MIIPIHHIVIHMAARLVTPSKCFWSRPIYLEEIDHAPVLFTTKCTSVFPQIVGKGQDGALPTSSRQDGLDSNLLVFYASTSRAIALSCKARPSSFQIDSTLTRAKSLNDLELAGNKGTGRRSINSAVEEGMNITANNVDDSAENFGVFLENVKGLGCGARATVTGRSKCGLGRADEGGELARCAVTIEYGFVSNDNELDNRPFGK